MRPARLRSLPGRRCRLGRLQSGPIVARPGTVGALEIRAHPVALASQPGREGTPALLAAWEVLGGRHRGLAIRMEHARRASRPRALESARIARTAARGGQGLPRRFWPVDATGLLPPDLVTILVSEPRDGAGPFHLPLHGVPRDRLAADEARASRAPTRDRHAAGGEQPAIREPLPDLLPRHLGQKIAAAGNVAQGSPAQRRAMRPRAKMLMTLRAQHQEQPSDVALSVHE